MGTDEYSHHDCFYLRRMKEILTALEKSENKSQPNTDQQKEGTSEELHGMNCQFLNPATKSVNSSFNNEETGQTQTNIIQSSSDVSSPATKLGVRDLQRNSAPLGSSVNKSNPQKQETSQESSLKSSNRSFTSTGSSGVNIKAESKSSHYNSPINSTTVSKEISDSKQTVNITKFSPSRNNNTSPGHPKVSFAERDAKDAKSVPHKCQYLQQSSSSNDKIECEFLKKSMNQNVSCDKTTKENSSHEAIAKNEQENDMKSSTSVETSNQSSAHKCAYIGNNKDKAVNNKCDFLESGIKPESEVKDSTVSNNNPATWKSNEEISASSPTSNSAKEPTSHKCSFLKDYNGQKCDKSCDFMKTEVAIDNSIKENSVKDTKSKEISKQDLDFKVESLSENNATPVHHKCSFLDKEGHNGKFLCEFLKSKDSDDSEHKGNLINSAAHSKDQKNANNTSETGSIDRNEQNKDVKCKETPLTDEGKISTPHKCNYLEDGKSSSGKITCEFLKKLNTSTEKENANKNAKEFDKNSGIKDNEVKNLDTGTVEKVDKHSVVENKEASKRPIVSSESSQADSKPDKMLCKFLSDSQATSSNHVCEYLKESPVKSSVLDQKQSSIVNEINSKYLEKRANPNEKLLISGKSEFPHNVSSKIGSQNTVYDNPASEPYVFIPPAPPVREIMQRTGGDIKVLAAKVQEDKQLTPVTSGSFKGYPEVFTETRPKFTSRKVINNHYSTNNNLFKLPQQFNLPQSSIMSRNEVNDSYRKFLLKLSKCEGTSASVNETNRNYIQTNRIIHEASSFQIWNYVHNRRNLGQSSVPRTKTRQLSFTEKKVHQLETVRVQNTNITAEKTKAVNTLSPHVVSNPNTQVQRRGSRKGKTRKSRHSETLKGNRENSSSDLDDLETSDRELLKSISPNSDGPRLNDLDLLLSRENSKLEINHDFAS